MLACCQQFVSAEQAAHKAELFVIPARGERVQAAEGQSQGFPSLVLGRPRPSRLVSYPARVDGGRNDGVKVGA